MNNKSPKRMKSTMMYVMAVVLLLVSGTAPPADELVFAQLLEAASTPKLFMPGTVTQRDVRHFGSSFSRHGDQVVYTLSDGISSAQVVIQTFENGRFSPPQVVVD